MGWLPKNRLIAASAATGNPVKNHDEFTRVSEYICRDDRNSFAVSLPPPAAVKHPAGRTIRTDRSFLAVGIVRRRPVSRATVFVACS